jgi:hypothetical protein
VRGGRGAALTLVVVVLAVVVVVVSLGTTPPPPFDARSTAPSGYAALARIVADRGADWESRTATSVAQQGYGPGDVLVVPAPDLASFAELDSLRDAAASGAVVVFGSPPPDPGAPLGEGALGPLAGDPIAGAVPDDDVLARQPAAPTDPGVCEVAELAALGPIDPWFAAPIPVEGRSSCFGDGADAHVVVEPVGDGRVVTLSGPELIANARLWPDKEGGGRPLDNAAVLVELAGLGGRSQGPSEDGGRRITFVRAEPSPDPAASAGQATNPLGLLPDGVRAALVAGVVAFCCYAWFRARRLGRVVREPAPVRIAGSELVVAVGELGRRRSATGRAAAALRAEFARRVGPAAGLGPAPDPARLVDWTARQSGRSADEVATLLIREVTSPEALVRLAGALDALEEEVSRVRHPR